MKGCKNQSYFGLDRGVDLITILSEMLDLDCGLDLSCKDLIDPYFLDLILDCVDLCSKAGCGTGEREQKDSLKLVLTARPPLIGIG